MEEVERVLTLEECTTILQNSLGRKDVTAESYSVNSLSATIEGFLGEHFIVKIEYLDNNSKKTQRCFMKILNGSIKTIFDISMSLNAYDKEEFFYTFLLRDLEIFDIDVSFAPKGYFCKPYLIVLEDLSLRGFKSAPKGEFFDLEHCKAALKVLARFHSASVLYETAKSKLFLDKPFNLEKTYPKMFEEVLFSNKQTIAKEWFQYSLEGIYGLINIIPENDITKEMFAEKLENFVKTMDTLTDKHSKYTCTMLHGDLWCNNFLFKYEDGVPTESTLLDYQLLKYGPPSMDVIHAILANTRKAFRDEHFHYLLEYYYQCFSKCIPELEVNKVLPKDEYLLLCDDLIILIKIQCICDRCVTFMPQDEIAEEIMDDEKLRIYLFEGRSKAIVNCFNNGGPFKELIEEDLFELRDMLFKKS